MRSTTTYKASELRLTDVGVEKGVGSTKACGRREDVVKTPSLANGLT